MRYQPKQPPFTQNADLQAVVEWMESEFREIANTLNNPEIEVMRFTVLHNEPDKSKDGDSAYADGADWNPGAGAGLYCRESGAWSKK